MSTLGVDDGRQQPLGQHVHLVAARLAPLDELDEARAGRAGELDARRRLRRRPAGRRPSAIVPTVPMTPTRPLRVAATSERTPGSMTPTTGTAQLTSLQLVEGGRGGGVARHDDQLHVVLVDQRAG